MPSKVFISYAYNDEPYCRELEKHLRLLQRRGLIDIWHHRRIAPGEHVGEAVDAQIETADLIVLLVSADFFDSEDYNGHPNLLLYAGGERRRFKVGVGYIVSTRTKDGCLRLFDNRLRQVSATACIDQKDRWWVQDQEGGGFRRVEVAAPK